MSPNQDPEKALEPPALDVPRSPSTHSGSTLYEEQPENPIGERPACFDNNLQECLFVLVATVAVGQNTILTGSMRSVTALIGRDLHMNDAEITWIVAGSTLTAGTFLLFFGRVADLFGRRNLLIGAMGMFSIFLLISGFATNALFFDAFMGLCGLACAAVVPPAVGTLGVIYGSPSKRRNRAFSCFGAGAPVGVVIGSFVSGIVTAITTWRAILWVLAVIYAIFTVIAWFTVPKDDNQCSGGWNMDTLRRFDLLGAFLITVGIAAFTAALTEAGVAPGGWSASYVIALLIVGVLLVIAFLIWENKYEYPLIPIDAWKDRNFTLLIIILCLGFYSFNNNSFWLTLVWQNVYDNNPLMVAVKFLPASIGGLIMCAVASMIIHRVGNKFISCFAAVSMVIASTFLSATNPGVSYWALQFLALIFSVVSQDLQFCVTNLYVVSSLPKEQRSIAGSLIQTTSRLSATIGLGIQTSVFKAVGGNIDGPGSDYYRPYQAAFWVSLGGAFLALFFLPFLTVGTQGNAPSDEEKSKQEDQSRSQSQSEPQPYPETRVEADK